jgi:hypothetical protein
VCQGACAGRVGGRIPGTQRALSGLDGAQAYVLILAGYETTANALAFALYLLSANPGKRDALLAEVDGFGRARVPTLHDLDR